MKLRVNLFLNPFFHSMAFLALNVLSLLVVHTFQVTIEDYVISGILYGVFIITNSVLVLWASKRWKYFGLSIIASVFLVLIFFGIAMMFDSQQASSESSMIFLIIIYHPILLLMLLFCRWIVSRIKS